MVADIPMPSQQYYLELEDPTIAKLNTDTSTVTAQEFGYTEIVLKDKSILYAVCSFCNTFLLIYKQIVMNLKVLQKKL